MEAHKAKAEGVSIFYMDPDGHEGITCTVAAEHGKTGPELRGIIEGLTSFFEGGNITLSVGLLRFERGQDFLDWIGKDRIAVEYEKEITQ